MIRILLSTRLGERRWTQADLARMTGIRPGTINDLYNEMAERVNLEHLDLICEALNCKAHAENAVYDAQDLNESAYDIIDLMSDRGQDSEVFVESIKQSVARTVTIVRQLKPPALFLPQQS